MKTIKKQFRTVSLLFGVIIMLQSCTVYKSTAVTLDQAAKTENKVKIKTKSNNTLKFKRVDFEDGKYYGVKKVNGASLKTPLEENNVSLIRVKNKTLSTVLSIGVPVVVVGGLTAIAAASCCGIDLSNVDWNN